MDRIKVWARNGDVVRQAIEVGEMAHLETVSAGGTDAFLLVASDSGLVQRWAGAFPEPRCEPEMAMEGILPAHSAARFAGLYSRRKAGDVLRSARVGGAWGSSVAVVEPERGLSVCGTSDDTLLSGEVVRHLLVQMAQQADLSPPARRPPPEPHVAGKVRERASRRAVKHAVDDAEAEARAHKVAEPWVDWDNQPVGVSMLPYARLGTGRRMHLLATTRVEVSGETGT